MTRHKCKEWTAAAKIWTSPVSAMPIIVTIAYLFWKGEQINWLYSALVLVGAMAVQCIGNMLSAKLCSCKSCPIMATHLVSDVLIFVLLGLMSSVIASYAATGVIDWSVLIAAAPAGLIGTSVYHSMNTRKLASSEKAGKSLGSIRFGAYLYVLETVSPYIWIGVCSAAGILPMHTVIIFLTIAIALGCATTMIKNIGQGETLLKDLDVRNANLQLLFGLLLSASLVAARLF